MSTFLVLRLCRDLWCVTWDYTRLRFFTKRPFPIGYVLYMALPLWPGLLATPVLVLGQVPNDA